MKATLIYLLLMLPIFLFANTDDKILQLEESLDGLTGKKYPKQCIKLSKLYAESGDYNRAYDVAIMGANQSRQNNFND
jgi:hypothetical protein